MDLGLFQTKNGLKYSGFIATEDIPTNSVLLRVPVDCLLTTRDAFLSEIQKYCCFYQESLSKILNSTQRHSVRTGKTGFSSPTSCSNTKREGNQSGTTWSEICPRRSIMSSFGKRMNWRRFKMTGSNAAFFNRGKKCSSSKTNSSKSPKNIQNTSRCNTLLQRISAGSTYTW